MKSPSPVIQGSISYAILGLNLREGFLGHACQAAQKLLCPVEMFMEGRGAGGSQGLGEGMAWSWRSNGTWDVSNPLSPDSRRRSGTLTLSSSPPTEVTRHKRCRSPDGSPESHRRNGHGKEKVRGRPPPAQWRSKEHPNSCRAGLYHRGGRFLGCAW